MRSAALDGLRAEAGAEAARRGRFRSRIGSPIGAIVVVVNRVGELEALDFADHEARSRRLLARYHGVDLESLVETPPPESVRAALAQYFEGRLSAIEALAVGAAGSAFQRGVWIALRAIPAGTTTTYGRLAEALGRPTACRAVGMANAVNPVAIVVPCHRVVGADGSLTGYGGGIERKRWLLDHERRSAGNAQWSG